MKKVICSAVIMTFVFVYGFAVAAPNNRPSASVTVVNTALNPVPVSGTITGTANVNITNTAPIPVTGNIGINGTTDVNITNSPTVNIGNTASNPVPVSLTSQSVITPFNVIAEVTFNFASGLHFSKEVDIPAGKRFVAEYISANCTIPDDNLLNNVRLYITANNTIHFFPFLQVIDWPNPNPNSDFNIVKRWIAGQVTRFYADDKLYINISRTSEGLGLVECIACVTGYLVDIP